MLAMLSAPAGGGCVFLENSTSYTSPRPSCKPQIEGWRILEQSPGLADIGRFALASTRLSGSSKQSGSPHANCMLSRYKRCIILACCSRCCLGCSRASTSCSAVKPLVHREYDFDFDIVSPHARSRCFIVDVRGSSASAVC